MRAITFLYGRFLRLISSGLWAISCSPLLIICLYSMLKALAGGLTEASATGYMIAFLLFSLLIYPWIRKQEKLFFLRIVYYHTLVIPLVFALSLISLIPNGNRYMTGAVFLVSMLLPSFIISLRQRRKGTAFETLYLKTMRVILDYSDALFWLLFSVFLSGIFLQDSAIIANIGNTDKWKLLLVPFIIQVKIMKAWANQRLLQMEKKPEPATES